MTRSKTTKSFGLIAITTLVLMVATTIGNAINTADAQGRPGSTDQYVNQRSQQAQGSVDQRGLVNVGNTQVDAQVAVPIDACASVIASNIQCQR